MAGAPQFATGLAAVVRGLAHRGGSTLIILLVAVAAAAAAAAGPIYYQSARISIMSDLAGRGPLIAHGYEANLTGPVDSIEAPLTSSVENELRAGVGAATYARVFAPPVLSLQGTGNYPRENEAFAVAWRTGMCAHLRITGSCPVTRNQVLVSKSVARIVGWHTGQRITGTGWPAFTVTGIYQPPDVHSAYWGEQATTYFPIEAPVKPGAAGSGFDAFFTAKSTLTGAPASQQGKAVIDQSLRTGSLRVADLPRLGTAVEAFSNSVRLSTQNIIVSTTFPATATAIEANWRTVAVPVVLITVQVLTLSWLLLFLAVTDAVEARGPELALAKLRGHGRWRTLVFGLSEPVVLLALALPAGALTGWLAASGLDRLLLRPGTPISVTALGWAAAAAATVGGLTAVLLASRRTLRREVVEEFRRSGRRVAARAWVIDAILLTGSVAGLLELTATGRVGSASHDVIGLLVPGLLGLAVAVVASRLLPLACRAAYGRPGRRGGMAFFLAVRHIARRPGGTRTTIVLAAAFALVTFAMAAWAVGRANYRLVADTQVGAPVVLTVTVPAGKDIGAIVGHADPGGHLATVVDSYVSLSGSTAGDVVLGVDPARFARVALWPPSLSAQPLAELTRRLDPPAPAPLTLSGDAMRVTVRVDSLTVPGEQLIANVTTGTSPVSLGRLPTHGTATLTGPLTGCPCVLRSLVAQVPVSSGKPASAKLTITGIATRSHGRWQQVRPQAFSTAADWTAGSSDTPPDQISAGPGGVTWSFKGVAAGASPSLESVNRPLVLPALIPRTLTRGRGGTLSGVGLDGGPLLLRPAGDVAAVPGAAGNGVIVDRHYAELAAGENFTYVTREVWLAAGAEHRIVPALKAAGVTVAGHRTASSAFAALSRSGPGLASLLFLADAAAAALLAVGAAILGLYLSARRRRYEYAALEASGVRRSTLGRSLLIELAVVLGFGTAAGIATGLGAAWLVLRSIPEFVTSPAAPPLVYAPPLGPLALLLAVAVGVLAGCSLAASLMLTRGVRAEQLREAPA